VKERFMKMARVILFTRQMEAMSKFYGDVLGLKQVTLESGWCEFAAGGVRIALHSGPPSPGNKGPKIVAPNSERSGRAHSVFATVKTRTEIPFSYPIAETSFRSKERFHPGGDQDSSQALVSCVSGGNL
jgi:catechol 2,3-dioxygenase-like lactoylglutathione lyase family enzyme